MDVCGSGPDFFKKISSQHREHLLILVGYVGFWGITL